MGFRDTPWSKTQYYRRRRAASLLGCSIYDVPDRRGKHGNQARGSANGRWTKSRIISEHGYVRVRVGRKHPLADPNGYAYEHLVVWCAAGNQKPSEDELIHHKNGDKTDNRISNLMVMKRSEHGALHIQKRHRDAAGRLLDGGEHNAMPEVQDA